tara:strand:+ start:907 stop:1113 length:207 start_codon:yes stop_codon:yes gene_type:complete
MLAAVCGYMVGRWVREYAFIWRIRMYFYKQGMNHEAVDRLTDAIIRPPMSSAEVQRIREERIAEGLSA